MRRACETAAEVLIRQKWSTLADVHVEHTPWRGLAACWARNAAWLRAPQVVAPDRAHVWRDALGRKPQAQARPGAAGGPRAEAEPAPAGLVLEHLDEPIQEGVAVVVASAAGDCTIFDCAATEGAQRLELCHGYPFPATDAAQPRVSAGATAKAHALTMDCDGEMRDAHLHCVGGVVTAAVYRNGHRTVHDLDALPTWDTPHDAAVHVLEAFFHPRSDGFHSFHLTAAPWSAALYLGGQGNVSSAVENVTRLIHRTGGTNIGGVGENVAAGVFRNFRRCFVQDRAATATNMHLGAQGRIGLGEFAPEARTASSHKNALAS